MMFFPVLFHLRLMDYIYDYEKRSFLHFKSSETCSMLLKCGNLNSVDWTTRLPWVKIILQGFFFKELCVILCNSDYNPSPGLLTSCDWLWLLLLSFLIFSCSTDSAVKLNRTMWRSPINPEVVGNVCAVGQMSGFKRNSIHCNTF